MPKLTWNIIIILITLIPSMAQTGCPEGYENGVNTIRNSNFNQGLKEFYSDYKKNNNKEWFAASIYVTDNPASVHNNYKLCLDSMYKNLGPLLIVDGSQNRNDIVWQQKVTVIPKTNYYFSIFFATLLKPNPAQIEISINGKRLSKPFDYHYQHCKGSIYFSFWNSDLYTLADISIKANTTDVMGNDFVLDNITFHSCIKREVVSAEKKISDSIACHFQVKGKNQEVIKACQILFREVHDTTFQKVLTDSTGSVSVKLPNKNYEISVQAKRFFRYKDTVSNIEDSVFSKVYYLSPLDSGLVFTLKSLTFDRSSAEISKESFTELSSIIELLNENPEISLEIHGHTDNQGDAVKNYELSLERVTNVKLFLVRSGIDKNRINGIGFGGTRPLVGFGTDEERKSNRRVEFVIVRNEKKI